MSVDLVYGEKKTQLAIADPVAALKAAAAELGITSLEGRFLYGRGISFDVIQQSSLFEPF